MSMGQELVQDVSQGSAPTTRWERVATTRWGAYVSEAEKRAILRGHELNRRPRTALEMGCEGGRWSRMLANLGWRMICADIDAEALAICQRKIPTATCILRKPEDTTLPCASDSVSLLLCIEVPPLVQSDWFITEAARVLDDDGLLVIVYWNLLSFRGVFSHVRAMIGGGLDFYRMAYPTWKKKVSQLGFQFVYEEGFCWFPFGRESDSALVPYATSLEKQLGLRR